MASISIPKQAENESVALFVARIKKTVLALSVVGEILKMSGSRMLFAFVNGLLPNFRQLRTMVTVMGKSFEESVDFALAEESQQALDRSARRGNTNSNESAHYVSAESSKPRGPRKLGGPIGECWICGSRNHLNRQCTVPCGCCGKKRHKTADCWDKNKGNASGQGTTRNSRAPVVAHLAMSTIESEELNQSDSAHMVTSETNLVYSAVFTQGYEAGKAVTKDSSILLDSGASKHYVAHDVVYRSHRCFRVRYRCSIDARTR